MSIDSYLRTDPIELPKIGSWPHAWHVFDEPSAYALAAAEAAERPLLIRGEPGTGKSQLARAAAVVRNRLFLSVVVDARTECQDLQWKFDTVARLGEAQILAHEHGGDVSTLRERMDPRRFLTPGPLWLAFDWTSAKTQYEQCDHRLESPPTPLEGWQPEHGSVLLIDEIDKSDEEFESLLLEMLSDYQVTIPEIGTIAAAGQPPIVFLTSNNSREVSDALKRRCLHLYIPYPDAGLEQQIIQARVPEITAGLRRQLVAFVQALREMDLRKAPAISETIDWARTLLLLHIDALDDAWIRETLNVLLKFQDDVDNVEAQLPYLTRRVADAR